MINPFSDTARAREGAHAHARRLPCTCSYAEAGDAAAEIVANCFPHCAKDFALWAWYCRHFDRRLIIDKAYYYTSCHRQGEVRDGVSAFQAWLRKEFPKSKTALDENTPVCPRPSRDTGVKPSPKFINYGHRCQSGECGGAVAERRASLPGIGADAVKGGAA